MKLPPKLALAALLVTLSCVVGYAALSEFWLFWELGWFGKYDIYWEGVAAIVALGAPLATFLVAKHSYKAFVKQALINEEGRYRDRLLEKRMEANDEILAILNAESFREAHFAYKDGDSRRYAQAMISELAELTELLRRRLLYLHKNDARVLAFFIWPAYFACKNLLNIAREDDPVIGADPSELEIWLVLMRYEIMGSIASNMSDVSFKVLAVSDYVRARQKGIAVLQRYSGRIPDSGFDEQIRAELESLSSSTDI